MLDKFRRVFARAEPEPVRAVAVPPSHALVPIVRFDHPADDRQMGALDRTADSARPTLSPAPMLRSFDEDVRRSWMPATAHARHLASVSGYLSYGIELMTSWIVGGDGLRLNLTPDHEELGWSADEASEWARRAEKLFAEWANDPMSCDARGKSKFGQLQGQAVRCWFLTGDILAALDYGPKRAAAWRSSIDVVDPMRLRVPIYQSQGVQVMDGIEFDGRGRPVAYHIKAPDHSGKTERVPVYGVNNKPMVCHRFDQDVGAVRGVSPLASAVGGILQALSAADAGVLAAHLHAMILGTVTTDMPTDALITRLGGEPAEVMTKLMGARADYHEGLKKARSDVQIGHGARVVHLSTGERLELHGAKNGFDDYETILKHGLREAARALGLSYEALTSDKSGATYSSLKYATVEQRAIVERRRKVLIEPLCEWALVNVLEEAIATRRLSFRALGQYRTMTPLQAFRELKRFACKAEWTGPAIPDPDELKSAKAAVMRMQYGLSSWSDEVGAMGKDADATISKIEAEREQMKRRKVFPPMYDGKRPIQNNGGST